MFRIQEGWKNIAGQLSCEMRYACPYSVFYFLILNYVVYILPSSDSPGVRQRSRFSSFRLYFISSLSRILPGTAPVSWGRSSHFLSFSSFFFYLASEPSPFLVRTVSFNRRIHFRFRLWARGCACACQGVRGSSCVVRIKSVYCLYIIKEFITMMEDLMVVGIL